MAGFEEDKLDAMLRQARPDGVEAPGFEQWADSHAEALVVLKTQGRFGAYKRRTPWHMARVAALLLVVIGLGFVCGRFSTGPKIDIDQLHAELETSIHSSLEASLEANGTQLKSEILTLLRQDLSVLTAQTLEISRAMTDQQLAELVRLIETVRLQDRTQIVTALEQIEQDRLRDKMQIQEGFKTLFAYTTENRKSSELN